MTTLSDEAMNRALEAVHALRFDLGPLEEYYDDSEIARIIEAAWAAILEPVLEPAFSPIPGDI
jgi:hypothetical protein